MSRCSSTTICPSTKFSSKRHLCRRIARSSGIRLQVDVLGAVNEGDRALRELAAVANAPIFSYDDSFLTGEIVGGPMTSVSVYYQNHD